MVGASAAKAASIPASNGAAEAAPFQSKSKNQEPSVAVRSGAIAAPYPFPASTTSHELL